MSEKLQIHDIVIHTESINPNCFVELTTDRIDLEIENVASSKPIAMNWNGK